MDASTTAGASAYAPDDGSVVPTDRHSAEVAVEVVGIVALVVALGVDLISRFVTHAPALHHIGTAVVVVAMVAAIIDAGITISAHQRSEDGFLLHVLLDVLAALLLVVSLVLRITYWENDQGTPVRAIVPEAFAFLIIALVTWTTITGRPVHETTRPSPAADEVS